jgi:hypothetical protein
MQLHQLEQVQYHPNQQSWFKCENPLAQNRSVNGSAGVRNAKASQNAEYSILGSAV